MSARPERRKGEAPERDLPRRRSSLVGDGRPPGVVARDDLEALLRAHDPEIAAENLARLGPQHGRLLRLIATEAASASADPRLRHNAVAALGHLGQAEDLNVVVELAGTDPDPAIRASALTTLANTGMVLAAPVLARALVSKDPVERMAAEKGLSRLAERVGQAAVVEAVRPSTGGTTRLASTIQELLQTPAKASLPGRARVAQSRADDQPGRRAKARRPASSGGRTP